MYRALSRHLFQGGEYEPLRGDDRVAGVLPPTGWLDKPLNVYTVATTTAPSFCQWGERPPGPPIPVSAIITIIITHL